MANKYGKAFFTNNTTVTWSHLHKPDVKFGNPNYNITVALTPELESAIKDAAQAAGFGKISKVNGVGNREDGKVLKVKNSQACRDGATGAFPCVDANAKATKAVPFGGDVVRLKLVPCLSGTTLCPSTSTVVRSSRSKSVKKVPVASVSWTEASTEPMPRHLRSRKPSSLKLSWLKTPTPTSPSELKSRASRQLQTVVDERSFYGTQEKNCQV